MNLPFHWYRPLETSFLILLLLGISAYNFSQLPSEEQREIELEAGLEQLYFLEQIFYQTHQRYFDPTDPASGLGWKWMEAYQWGCQAGPNGFWIRVQADLDSDGAMGIWRIDQKGPTIHRLIPD